MAMIVYGTPAPIDVLALMNGNPTVSQQVLFNTEVAGPCPKLTWVPAA